MLKGALARVELAARFAADRPNRSKFDEQQANALRVPPPPSLSDFDAVRRRGGRQAPLDMVEKSPFPCGNNP